MPLSLNVTNIAYKVARRKLNYYIRCGDAQLAKIWLNIINTYISMYDREDKIVPKLDGLHKSVQCKDCDHLKHKCLKCDNCQRNCISK